MVALDMIAASLARTLGATNYQERKSERVAIRDYCTLFDL